MAKKPPAVLTVVEERKTLKQIVMDKLRNAILDLHFKPGQRLVERELCEMMGVSRTAVREALSFLSAEGLVTMVPNKGPIVTEITLDQACDIYEVRAALEGLASQLFVIRAGEDELEALIAAKEELKVAFERRDIHEILEAASVFFDVIYDGSGNQVIRSTIRPLLAQVNYLRARSMSSEDRYEDSFSEIEKIVSAISKRDEQAAFDASVNHVFKARDAALASMIARGEAKISSENVRPKLINQDQLK